ncbi:COP9 signalosome complex subunit 7-like [Drosophila miranda]|uniref:COP9 signalosome complex subunit 7-like n=1 Tax=Drosophila miranda TaxID=7229 RepID=UPI00143F9305|nr:COP9 signalosome complex subunit 7-like [Drosophila miranda]
MPQSAFAGLRPLEWYLAIELTNRNSNLTKLIATLDGTTYICDGKAEENLLNFRFYVPFSDIIHGKLFQNTRILEVEYAQGRDIPPGNTGKIVEILQAWFNSCDGVSSCIENQIKYANSEKSKRLFNKDRVEQDLINLKKMLKSQASDSDENMQIDTHGPSGSGGLSLADLRKKPSKMKAQRNTGVGLKFSM